MTRSEIPRYAKALPPLLLAAAAISVYLAYGVSSGNDIYVWAVAAAAAGIAFLVLSVSLRRYDKACKGSAEEAFLRMASGPAHGSSETPRGKIPR
ncbi:MAG: hypothetical protein PHI62_01585 [Candidatus Methanomethylophilaceae archaeon]|nr:hypothetical protein [Candidatus Methanomethylophilaceae archaeon]